MFSFPRQKWKLVMKKSLKQERSLAPCVKGLKEFLLDILLSIIGSDLEM